MPRYPWIEFPLCFIAVVGPLVVVCCRLCTKKTTMKHDGTATVVQERAWGIGVRMIQLTTVLVLVPVIAILRLEDANSGVGVGTLLGAIVGYALGGIMNPVPKTKKSM